MVCPDKKRFLVHQDLLIYPSALFDAALNGKSKDFATMTGARLRLASLFVFTYFPKKIIKNEHSKLQAGFCDALFNHQATDNMAFPSARHMGYAFNNLPERPAALQLLMENSVLLSAAERKRKILICMLIQ